MTKEKDGYFDWYVDRLENHSLRLDPSSSKCACPCCQYLTLDERGGFEICPICYWEDDGQDEADKDTVRGGPNGGLSLTQARINFQNFGACEPRFLDNIRKPKPEETPADFGQMDLN